MTHRTTTADLERAARILAGEMHLPYGANWRRDENGQNVATVGALDLDGAYGGYKLVQIVTDGGGTRDIAPGYFMPKAALLDCLRMAADVLARRSDGGTCANCGAPMYVMVPGHHHTENGRDVTR